MIDWKHPEVPILVAKRLKEKGYQFHLKMIGVGPLFGEMENLIKKNALENHVSLLRTMPPQEVRKHMENSSIFMFTSDQNEGWGAVLNEAMNSGCVVVANQQIGSVPFLLNDGKNGRCYYKNKIKKIVKIIEDLFNDEEKTAELGKNAYDTIVDHWSAKNATERLVEICTKLLVGKKDFFEDGPCSKAKIRVKKG